jgi:hypothetical protein
MFELKHADNSEKVPVTALPVERTLYRTDFDSGAKGHYR